MHSAAETYLRKLDLLKPTGRYSAMGQPIYDFFGKTVIVDDSIAYDTETGASEMYLFGNGAIAWGNGNDPKIKATEVYRDAMKLAGEDVLINRRLSILHPRGVNVFTDREAAINYVDLCYAMGWDWALFTEDITDSTRFVIANIGFAHLDSPTEDV